AGRVSIRLRFFRRGVLARRRAADRHGRVERSATAPRGNLQEKNEVLPRAKRRGASLLHVAPLRGLARLQIRAQSARQGVQPSRFLRRTPLGSSLAAAPDHHRGAPPPRMDLLYFVILVSSLIFVHELGHFLFAKAFGVKVLTFSLGFGPKVLRLRGRETEYCVGVLPLGGYVKMLEASKSDTVLPEDRRRTFESLPAFKRVLIVLAGPLMNIVFPVLLYFSVFVGDGPFLPPTVGVVLPGHPAEGKLFPG